MPAVIVYIAITGIVSAVKVCQVAFECSNESIEGDDFEAYGYKSASGPNTTIDCTNSNCRCMGAFSCSNVLNISFPTELWCYGSNSCSNIDTRTYINSKNDTAVIWCSGANTCTSSVIRVTTTDNFLLCGGLSSCANAQISGIKRIYATGAYSLYGATIHSNDAPDNYIDVLLYGYNVALGAQIICQPGDQCHITCPQNKCDASHINCTGNCVFHPIDSYVLDSTITTNIDVLYNNLKDITAQNEEQCDNKSIATSFDGINTPFDDTLINNTSYICCRGRRSCYNKTIHNHKTLQQFVFSARGSFHWSSLIEANGPLFCSAAFSCYLSTITNHTDNIYCVGDSACREITIKQTHGDVMCFGVRSCEQSLISTSGDGQISFIYFLGEISGLGAHIKCKQNDRCTVVCAAYHSCFNTTLTCDGICTVECDDSFSLCPNISTMSPTATTLNPNTTSNVSPPNPTMNPFHSVSSFPSPKPTIDPLPFSSFYPSYEASHYFINTLSTVSSLILNSTTNLSQSPSLFQTKKPQISNDDDILIAVISVLCVLSVFVSIFVAIYCMKKKKKMVRKMTNEVNILPVAVVNLNEDNWENWSNDDVMQWIASLQNGKFKEYAPAFAVQNIQGIHLGNITKSDLMDFGIETFVDRVEIFNHIQNLLVNIKDEPEGGVDARKKSEAYEEEGVVRNNEVQSTTRKPLETCTTGKDTTDGADDV